MRAISIILYILAFDAAVIALGSYAWDAVEGAPPRLLAEHLIELGASLEAWQAGVQRHVSADLWDRLFVPALTAQTITVFGALALFLGVAGYASQLRRR